MRFLPSTVPKYLIYGIYGVGILVAAIWALLLLAFFNSPYDDAEFDRYRWLKANTEWDWFRCTRGRMVDDLRKVLEGGGLSTEAVTQLLGAEDVKRLADGSQCVLYPIGRCTMNIDPQSMVICIDAKGEAYVSVDDS